MHIPIICPKNYYSCSFEIEYNPQKIFVLMPFGEEQAPQSLFTDVLKELPGWQVERADTDLSKPEIWCKICANIQESRAIVADLPGRIRMFFLN